MNVPSQSKKKRNRHKKNNGLCWKKKAAKESTISIDPFLADMAYNQKLSDGKAKKPKKNSASQDLNLSFSNKSQFK